MNHIHLLQRDNIDYFKKDLSVSKSKSNINLSHEDTVHLLVFDDLFTIFTATGDDLEMELTIDEREKFKYRDEDGFYYFDDCALIEELSNDLNFVLELYFRTRVEKLA